MQYFPRSLSSSPAFGQVRGVNSLSHRLLTLCRKLAAHLYRPVVPSSSLNFQPTIIFSPPEDGSLIREEIFGPVLCISTFADEADVIQQANDTE